jgi:1-pyrroline-5-carboxylate dehydrogenase
MRHAYQVEPPLDMSIEANRAKMREAIAAVGQQLGKRYPLVIGGQRIETGQWIRSTNPGNPDQLVGEVARARVEDVEAAFQAAGAAFATWKKMSAEGRASVLFKAAAIIKRRRFELNAWMAYELDKPWGESDGEVAEAVDFLEYYAHLALKLVDRNKLDAHLADEANAYRYQPLGIGVVVPPWNFPCAIFTGMIGAPVVAGNAVIVKPASNTPVIGYKMVEIFEEAGVPAGVINLLPGGGSEIGDRLVDDIRTRFVAFTGSKDIGIRINERAAKVHPGQRWIKRVSAEMGGKDAIIVDKAADLDDAVAGIVTSAFGFSGQKCSACSRALIHADVYDEVVAKLVARAAKVVTVGGQVENAALMGAVIDKNQYDSITRYIEIGKSEGRVVWQGDIPAGLAGYYVRPTIIADVAPSARIACEEIFGPVLAVVKVDSFQHALDVANDSEYGLTGSVYSRDRAVLEQAREEFEVGNLYLNRKCTGAFVGVHPFAGFKLSGTNSKAGGPDYLLNFTEVKSVGEKL